MAIMQRRWECPCCGAELLVIAALAEEAKPRGGRPRGSRNKPKPGEGVKVVPGPDGSVQAAVAARLRGD